MSLKGTALRELADDPRFPTPWILAHWVHGAAKEQLIQAIRYRQWPITATWWLSEDEQRLMRRRAALLAAIEKQECLVS